MAHSSTFTLFFIFLLFPFFSTVQSVNATCLSGSAPFIIAETCAPGFYCPFLPSPPTFCSPTQDCSLTRLANKFCPPQGTTEPEVCPKGYYCPTPVEKYKCPSGHYCRIGSVAPVKCSTISICAEGSSTMADLSSLIICLILDIVILGVVLFFKKVYNKRGSIKLVPMKEMAPSSPIPSTSISILEDAGTVKVVSEGLINGYSRARNNQSLPMEFDFTDLYITLPSGKHLLQGVSGTIKPGRLTAIMGPSGAGKTTFMNCLMGKVKRTGGSLSINTNSMEMHNLKHVIGYVPQEDIMIPELTVRENIHHSASIRLPSSWSRQEISAFTDAIIEALDLSHVADTIVGDATKRGVSGGQKKRTNIGMELVAAPLSIFLDEPTSGLDSTAALKVAHILRDIRQLGLTIVAVIHQPRQEIFDTFDDLLMIAPGGRTAYLGPRSHVVKFYENQGFVFDLYKNQADELMDILSGKGTKVDHSSYSVGDLVQFWDDNKADLSFVEKDEVKPEGQVTQILELSKERGGNFFSQALLCHNRSLVQQYRLIGALCLEIAVALIAGGVMGAAASGNDHFQGSFIYPFTLLSPSPVIWFQPMLGMLMGMAVGLAGSPAGVKTFGEEKLVYYREAASGHNRVAYYIGKMISMYYREILAALHFTMIYHLLAQPIIEFHRLFSIILLFFFAVYGLAAVVSFLVKRENASLLAVVICLFAGVFNGFGPNLVDARDWKMIWFWDISYARWLSEAMFSDGIYPYRNVYDVKIAADQFGYKLDQFGSNLGIAFAIGAALHSIGLVSMLLMNRQKQR